MKKLLLNTFALTVLGLVPLAAPAVQAMGFQNCTGKSIRVHIYNNNDRVMMFARNGGKVKAGEVRIWNQGKKDNQRAIKVFETGFFDKLVLTKNNLDGKSNYQIIKNDRGNLLVKDNGTSAVGTCPT